MPFDLAEFRQAIVAGVETPNYFKCDFFVPRSFYLGSQQPPDTRNLSFLCMGTSLPGPRIETASAHRYGYGPSYSYGIRSKFNDITCNFITDGGGLVNRFFRLWMRSAVEFSSNGDPNQPLSDFRNVDSGMIPFMCGYRNDYSTLIVISMYNKKGELIDQVNLNQAFPVNVSDVSLDWSLNDQYLVTPVSFNFKDLIYDTNIKFNSVTGFATPQDLSFLTSTLSIITSVPGVASNLVRSL